MDRFRKFFVANKIVDNVKSIFNYLLSSLKRSLKLLQQFDPELEKYLGSTLHIPIVAKESVNIVQKLIKCGADINACDDKNWTPLHYAVFHNDLELVCLLLYYGAHIRIESKDGETSLMLAFQQRNEEIMRILLNYYYEFDKIDLTNMILDYEGKINNYEDNLLLALSFCNGYSGVFKLIWPRIDIEKLRRAQWLDPGILYVYLSCEDRFTPSEWLDCLYLILKTPNIIHFLYDEEWFLVNFFGGMVNGRFYTRRMDFLYTLFSIGIKIDLEFIDQTYAIFGFNQQLEALIYAGNHDWVEPEFPEYIFLHFTLSFKVDCNTRNIYKYFYKLLVNPEWCGDPTPWLKQFSLPSKLKTELVNLCYEEEIKAEIDKVTEFPSLLELGRLAVQRLIKQTHKITKPYQFHDAVKELCLPQHLKDIVLFKRPIYK